MALDKVAEQRVNEHGVRIAINLGATCKLSNLDVFYMKLRTALY